LIGLLKEPLNLPHDVVDPIVPSPQPYHYRSRMDIRLLKTRSGEVLTGFSPVNRNRIVSADTCAIAMTPIADFLPALRVEARGKLPERYRNANLVVKTGDDGRIFWGGIGRRSLAMEEKDYLWTVVKGIKIFYSLDVFFQANLSILPLVIERVEQLGILDKDTVLFDLYGGVGLFGLCLYRHVKEVRLIEENKYAVKLAEHNMRFHGFDHFKILSGTVEDHLAGVLADSGLKPVAIIDPPRQGLSEQVSRALAGARHLRHLLYLSCDPRSLARDLNIFQQDGWEITRIIPFDFFPKTHHLETLAVLRPRSSSPEAT